MRLLLIRHGLTDKTGPVLAGWTPGVHLNEAGRAQAERLAERLADVPVDAIYSSPLERCRETVAPVARGRRIRVKIDKHLGEVGYGDWTGQELPKLAKTPLWRVVQYRPSMAAFPNGESLLAASHRIIDTLEAIRTAHAKGGNVVCASHADMIKLAVAHYCGMHIDQYQRIVVSPASVTVIRFGSEASCQVEHLNDTGDLGDLRPAKKSDREPKRSKATEEWGHA